MQCRGQRHLNEGARPAGQGALPAVGIRAEHECHVRHRRKLQGRARLTNSQNSGWHQLETVLASTACRKEGPLAGPHGMARVKLRACAWADKLVNACRACHDL